MPTTHDLVVLFGKPGAGKDYASSLLERYCGYHVLYADLYIQGSYLIAVRSGHPSTPEMRKVFIKRLIPIIHETMRLHKKVIINYTFNKADARADFMQAFPQASWIKIDTSMQIIKDRLTKAPRTGHLIQDINFILELGAHFDPADFPHYLAVNNTTDTALLSQLQKVLTSSL